LIDSARANRSRVYFYEPDDVGILPFDEIDDALEIRTIAQQVPHPWDRPVHGRTEAEAVANVVQE
jgi:hypothetical protein